MISRNRCYWILLNVNSGETDERLLREGYGEGVRFFGECD